ncbi:MAG: hypothetical protein ACREWE_00860 [Gammaproteobacteria bacterium]
MGARGPPLNAHHATVTVPGRDPIEFTDVEGKDLAGWRLYARMQFGPDATVSTAPPAEVEDLKEFFEERSAILEYDAGLPRPEAELEAARITATLARNRGYLWASLREALAESPVLLAQLPVAPGQVDSLPFGVASVHVRPDGHTLRQGTFTGPPEARP